MKINLVVLKDEDNKDAITYQSWCWDLTVYHCTGCWDCTLLPSSSIPYKVTQGVLRSLGMEITLDDVLTILDESYNNVKALDALNQAFFGYTWVIKRQYQTQGCACWDTFRFSWHHSWNAFLQTMYPSCSMTTFMVDSLNGLKSW